MIICPECGKENTQESKFCRNCGVNLVHEYKTTVDEEPPKKTTVISDNTYNQNHQNKRVNTHKSTTDNNKSKKDEYGWCVCCICLFFLFMVFAIAGH